MEPQTAQVSNASDGPIVIVLNPASGRGQGARRAGELRALLAAHAGSRTWRIVETTAPGAARDLAAQAVSDGAAVVAAAGGDGTYGEVANALAQGPVPLAVLPLGTGNDFARCLGFGPDLPAAVDALLNGEVRAMDLGRIGDRWFLNVAGCGFDAATASRVNRGYRWLHGAAAYTAAVLDTLRTFRPVRMRIETDAGVLETGAMLCSIANTQTYGGGMRIAPDARPDDGLFDLCILKDVTRMDFLRSFPRVFKGTHITHPRVVMVRTRVVSVDSVPAMPVLVDGEVVGMTPFTATCEPGAIQVVCPRAGGPA